MDGKKWIILHPLFTFLTLLFVLYPEINSSTAELYCYDNNCGFICLLMRNISGQYCCLQFLQFQKYIEKNITKHLFNCWGFPAGHWILQFVENAIHVVLQQNSKLMLWFPLITCHFVYIIRFLHLEHCLCWPSVKSCHLNLTWDLWTHECQWTLIIFFTDLNSELIIWIFDSKVTLVAKTTKCSRWDGQTEPLYDCCSMSSTRVVWTLSPQR